MSKSLKLFGAATLGVAGVMVVAVNFADRNIAGMPAEPQLLGALPAPEPVETAEAPQGLLVGAAQAATSAGDGKFGLGRTALPEEVAAWDHDISPDGTGLPVGAGSVEDGEMLFEDNCASCHGSFAEGVGNWPKLAGGDGTLNHADPLKTVGSFWPYLSTVYDYVHRSMPFGNAQILSDDEVYAITAYILYSNDLVDDEFVLSNENFTEVEMPNSEGFIVDDRSETEYPQWRAEPCMEACKDEVEITMRATVLDVTPDQAGSEAEPAATEAAAAPAEDAAPAAAEPETAEAAPAEPAVQEAAFDPDLAAEGEKIFNKCKACHQVGEGASNRTGPELNGIVGREVAAAEGFKYSDAMMEHGGTWTPEELRAFLANPRQDLKGTRMAFAGLRKDEDLDAVIEYLKSFP